MPLYPNAEEARPGLELLDRYLAEAGRSRAGFGLEARIPFGQGNPTAWQRLIEGWQKAGATHLSLLTTSCGFTSPQEHLNALRRFAEAIGLSAAG